MFNSLASDTTIWLVGLVAVAILVVAIPLARFAMRRRMRKQEWSASHDPITIDFTGLTGFGSRQRAESVLDDNSAERSKSNS